MMQDPNLGVREAFGAKLRTHVLRLQTQGWAAGADAGPGAAAAAGWLPSKYAAVLPLAGGWALWRAVALWAAVF